MRTTKSTLVYSSKTDSRWHILSSADTAPEEKLLKVIFVDKEVNNRLRINRYGYNYKPSTEWMAFHKKFKMKK